MVVIPIGGWFSGADRVLSRKEIEIAEVLFRLEQTAGKFQRAINVIAQAVIRIKATSRFGQSEEAKVIREWLMTELRKLLPEGDPRC